MLKLFKKDENGSAIVFGLLLGIIGIALGYIVMISTVQSLNVTAVTTVNGRLQQAAETGINDAVGLINGGYAFTTKTQASPFTGKDRITHHDSGQTSNIHWEWWVTPFDLTNRTDCDKTGSSANYNCGYYLYSKASMPEISSVAEVTMRAIIVPVQAASAERVGTASNYMIQYSSNGGAVYRHGIYGLDSLSIGQGVGLYSYYSVDTATGAIVPTDVNSTSRSVSLASNSGITVDSSRVGEADIAAFNLMGGSDSCSINAQNCTDKKKNKQTAIFSLDNDYTNIEERCTTPTTLAPDTSIKAGVTCVNGNLTLTNNTVSGTISNPTVLIVNGDLIIDSNAKINVDKAPSFLRIYVRGKVSNTQTTNGDATVNALITAFGKSSNGTNLVGTTINLAPHATGKINFYGSIVAPSIALSGSIDFWQDLNSKYLKEVGEPVYYQLFNVEQTSSVRDNIPISIIGEMYSGAITNANGETITGGN